LIVAALTALADTAPKTRIIETVAEHKPSLTGPAVDAQTNPTWWKGQLS
jgi:hypothetical protein